jgi:predicted DNA-binding ribbon-helix-helix protein
LLGRFTGKERTLPNGSKSAHDSSMIKKRSITIHGHRTSVSLEEPFWIILRSIATQRGLSLARLVQMIDKERKGTLSSALRLFVLAELTQNTAGHATKIKSMNH